MNPEYIERVGYEAQLKQELATIAGFGGYNLTDYTIEQLIKEIERQGKDYLYKEDGLFMHPTVQDAYLYLSFGHKPVYEEETA